MCPDTVAVQFCLMHNAQGEPSTAAKECVDFSLIYLRHTHTHTVLNVLYYKIEKATPIISSRVQLFLALLISV